MIVFIKKCILQIFVFQPKEIFKWWNNEEPTKNYYDTQPSALRE
jgi:hypothetical protein